MSESDRSLAITELLSAGCLKDDPLPWVLSSNEPFAVWAALTSILGRPSDDPEVLAAHSAVVTDARVLSLIDSLPADPAAAPAGHHSPQFLPNRLRLLADMGLTRGDSKRLDAVLEGLAARFDSRGRLGSSDGNTSQDAAGCDLAAVTEVLLRFGFGGEPAINRAVGRLKAGATNTAQGQGWTCGAERRSLIAALSSPADACPQIVLEGLRVWSTAPDERRTSSDAEKIARTPIELWMRRSEERPHEFGHGYQFKTIKWPSFWYDALSVVDAIGRFPVLWTSGDAASRRAVAELAACLIAYNVDDTGRVTPKRVHRDFDAFSFGQKISPSPFATAQLLAALARIADLAPDIAAVDVSSLPSSRGGGRAVQPEAAPATGRFECAAPVRRSYRPSRILPRILARHHLDTPWEQQSVESITADIVGLPAGSAALPYLALTARMPKFDPAALDQALYARHSLVRIRCMRGQLYAVRRDFVPVVHAASSRQVVRHARAFATSRGVTPADYDQLAAAILDQVVEMPLSLRQLRERITTRSDLGAVLTVMTAERVLITGERADGRFGRQKTYLPLKCALPDVDLDSYSEDEARKRLLRAYVRGFGPVTRQDAAWWTGMDLKRVRRAFESLEDELIEVGFDDSEGAWLMHAADAEELEWAALVDSPIVALLPANDPLLSGYADRSRFIEDAARPYCFDRAGNSAPLVLVDGHVVAVWDFAGSATPARSDSAVTVRIFPVAPIGYEAAERIAGRADAMVRVRFGEAACAGVEFAVGMRPLTGRPIGAFRHPLT